ncbi:invasion associated locus B family protein [Candidatus Neoehrlichia procyonis]|uniref:Invasion associated locus B family protein n=1 Tax=Candidatus Neoehrlichia procyonis str. RAC413 TaxID=1359163 RepID=A0A0F3NLF7_9RICK|nr:invasion associated locus B family protein [Candidatus Neoehrlichia lotoris]KJV68875.1 invasion associated locus B family protein [Candidatus Neoehrlichia lotoris str. RAC413]
MLINRYLIIIILLTFNTHCFASVLQGASNIKLIEKNKDWSVYTALQDGQKLCYLLSYPINNGKKSNSVFMITYISKILDEVSVSSGIKYKQNPIKLIIDHKKIYYLSIIENDVAWAENINIDAKIVNSMKKGLSLVVKGISASNKKIEDSYSLLGFDKSYKKMRQICNY